MKNMATKKVVSTASQASALFRAALPKAQNEERVFVLPLDATGRVLAKPILVSVGHEAGTATIDPGAIFREAFKAGAEEIIVAHNHPLGDPSPSKADIDATRRLKAGAELVGLVLLDHLILGANDAFASLAEAGALDAPSRSYDKKGG